MRTGHSSGAYGPLDTLPRLSGGDDAMDIAGAGQQHAR